MILKRINFTKKRNDIQNPGTIQKYPKSGTTHMQVTPLPKDYDVSDIFGICGKILQVGLKLTRWGKNPPGGHKQDSKMCWVQLLTSTITQFCRIKGGGGSGCPLPSPPPLPIIFERQILPQQIIYCWKCNLTASRIHFIYRKNILISRLYEQFSRNDSAISSEWLSEKISNFYNMNVLYVI